MIKLVWAKIFKEWTLVEYYLEDDTFSTINDARRWHSYEWKKEDLEIGQIFSEKPFLGFNRNNQLKKENN